MVLKQVCCVLLVFWLPVYFVGIILAFSALTLLVGWQEGHPAFKKWGMVEVALVSPDGVAPSRMVCVSASVNLPLHHKVPKFTSGTGSPGWSWKKGRKTVVVVVICWHNTFRHPTNSVKTLKASIQTQLWWGRERYVGILQAGKGLLRSLLADHQVIADLVPVDLPVNMMIAVAWARANATKSLDVSCAAANSSAIYHITTGGLNPFTWGEMENAVISCFKNNPLESCFRRPKYNILTSNRLKWPAVDFEYTCLAQYRRMLLLNVSHLSNFLL